MSPLIPSTVRLALSCHADAEIVLCEAIDAWHAARLPALRHAARIRVQSAVLAARMARGAVAQARREAALASPQGGNPGDKIAQIRREMESAGHVALAARLAEVELLSRRMERTLDEITAEAIADEKARASCGVIDLRRVWPGSARA